MNATPTLITPADAARLGTPSDTVWLDVRSPMEYREVHLAGSRLVPLDAMQGPALASELAGKKVVIICRSGNRAKQAAATLAAGRTANGAGLMINSSRAVLYAGKGEDFAEAARKVALETRDAINAQR